MTTARPPLAAARLLLRAELLRRRQGRADVAYKQDPVGWMVDRLGVRPETIRWSQNPGYAGHRWDGDRDPLAKALEALAEGQDVGVESGTGTGKTYVLGACTVLWFLACFEDAVVVTMAPKEDQLRLHCWKEIRRLWPRFQRHFPDAEISDLRIRMRPGQDSWGAAGFACGVDAGAESATRAQGFHARDMLFVLEESPGIAPPIWVAIENTSTSPHNLRLALGNPDHQQDPLHQFCLLPGVTHVRVSALDYPNVVTGHEVVPGAVGPAAIERRRRKYGEDSRLYQSRVRGISPTESAEALIRRAWCLEAVARYGDRALREGRPALGVDVANSEAGDRAAIARGRGACVLEVASFPCPDASKLGTKVATEIRALRVDPLHVGVDAVGVGASTVNKLRELGYSIEALNGGERPKALGAVLGTEEEEYNNLRSQMHWQLRVDLQHGLVALPDDPELIDDLTTPRWETRGGKIVVESKEEIRKRLGRSPDKGDAVVYWNWARERRDPPTPERPAKAHHERVHERTRAILEKVRRRQQRADGIAEGESEADRDLGPIEAEAEVDEGARAALEEYWR